MKKWISEFFTKTSIGSILYLLFGKKGALKSSGWFLSIRKKSSVDKDGNPLPWLTYPLIYFLEPNLTKQLDVFEYGSGNSTLWFAERVRTIKSVEYHEKWFTKIKSELPDNAQIQFSRVEDSDDYGKMAFKQLSDSDPNRAYVNTIQEFNQKYDLIIIDGLYRPSCISVALQFLKDGGVFIIDNSDYQQFQPFLELLKNEEFRRIDFWGMCPIEPVLSCTSIFYRQKNWLNV